MRIVSSRLPLPRQGRVVRAALVAGTLSGVPSTVLTRHPISVTRAAGSLLGRPTVPRGLTAHAVLSLGWAAVLDRVLPDDARWYREGAAAGLAIAALDLGLVGRFVPRVRALPQVPQWLDHVAYGMLVTAVLRRP
jgi:hypothetical protein